MRNLTTLTLLTTLSAPVLANSVKTEQITPIKEVQTQSNKGFNSNITLSFEDSNLPDSWLNEDDGWTITTEQSSDGQYAIKTTAGKITWTADFGKGYLSFDIKGDGSSYTRQNFSIYFNDYISMNSSTQADWQTFSLNIPDDITSISFFKDSSRFNQSPIYIDNIRFIPHGHDSDNDQMPDQWELENGLNYSDSNDANLDPDEDGLTNLQEYQLGTIPDYYDSDGDDVNDSQDKEPLNPEVQ